jgi:tRNA(Ile2) C34 agmatinyltransferase TiaS
MDDFGQPRCPVCGTVMRDDPHGFRCGGCGYLEDHTADVDAVVIPPGFEGPSVRGG